ncbi:MAG: ammonium transporter [Candidatus Omnitrophota bacterium]|jgi:Amt family ammonium transporter|nr:MAG: ammonium transporter [Candidatus Omnitrophota bacterium]
MLYVWLFVGAASALSAFAEEETSPAYVLQDDGNILWTCIAAFLVFFMQAGFAMVETGFTRAKNAINIMMKNILDFSIGSLAFWLVGFGLMFGTTAGNWIGTDGFALSGLMFGEDGAIDYWTFAFWMFQVVFAATAATIVSGAMAERTKFHAYLIYSVCITAIVYPIFGHWAWGSLFHGEGWLENLGFVDFAGSTVVHSVGGWAGLAGAIVLGARKGKFIKGVPQAIPGHNIPMAALGVFILWLGWFGFNPGSTTTVGGDLAVVAVTTNLAAAAGTVGAMITAWSKFKYPDVGMTLNGALAGLVAITAPCYNVSPFAAIVIGFLAGVLVVIAVQAIESFGIDDPVGAVSVHGVCGAWGTLSVGLFAYPAFGDGPTGLFYGGGISQLLIQAVGVIACFVWTFTICFILFKAIKATVGLRVSEQEEMEGLDYGEHGGSAYPDFTTVVTH